MPRPPWVEGPDDSQESSQARRTPGCEEVHVCGRKTWSPGVRHILAFLGRRKARELRGPEDSGPVLTTEPGGRNL